MARRRARHSIFISYSHRDTKWLDELMVPLGPMVRDEGLHLWADNQILPGARWRQDIDAALATAKVAVLLVSPHFMNSDFIARVELPSLLTAAEQNGLTVLWVAVSDTRYEQTPIGAYQAAHAPAKPLDSLKPAARKKALNKVAEHIDRAFRTHAPARRPAKPVKAAAGGGKRKSKHKAAPAAPPVVTPSDHPDADHCLLQFIDRVDWGTPEQTQMLRTMLRKVMVDGLLPDEAWEMLGLEPAVGRRLWFIGVKQFSTHFNRFVTRLLEFKTALEVTA